MKSWKWGWSQLQDKHYFISKVPEGGSFITANQARESAKVTETRKKQGKTSDPEHKAAQVLNWRKKWLYSLHSFCRSPTVDTFLILKQDLPPGPTLPDSCRSGSLQPSHTLLHTAGLSSQLLLHNLKSHSCFLKGTLSHMPNSCFLIALNSVQSTYICFKI